MWDLDQAEADFFQTFVIGGLAPLAGERTTQALYHIFQGRRANQTYQDVEIFQLYPYYRLFPRLSREHWQKTMETCVEHNLIVLEKMSGTTPKMTFALTEKGQACRAEGWERYELSKWLAPLQESIQGPELQEMWLRLHLLIQTVSQLIDDALSFFPQVGQRTIQAWVKLQLRDKEKREDWKRGLYDELALLLDGLEPQLQRLLIGQWSGARKTGMTMQQIALSEERPPSLVIVMMMSALALCKKQLQAGGARQFPLLSCLVEQKKGGSAGKGSTLLSSSAEATLAMLGQGLGIAEIAAARQLRANTIEDHLVEIALRVPEWDMSDYLQPEDMAAIIQAARQLKTRRLRMIKDHFGTKYTYLQIRLALTGRGEGGTG
ncbi:helix-turn-helix domain-containing protein [Brevibacillus fluminis]|uniref:helix-turn-helix domain-containing protein n=1 Tax=Brevibacillus fluminis TaxID=511487 RepID=UPI003F8B9716